jgi:hypothetical protein
VTATLLSALLAYSTTRNRRAASPLRSGYTMELTVLEDGKLVSRATRRVKSNGDFLEETDHLNPDGSVSKHTRLAGTSAGGAVMIDDANKRLTYLGRAGLISAVTDAELKNLKGYNREDSLLGFRVIVQRSCDEIKRCTEYWVAPEIGSDNLKVDVDFGDGHRLTKTATSLMLGEPSFGIPDYPSVAGERVANPAKL